MKHTGCLHFTLDEAMGGAILFSMVAEIACIVYNIENREE